MKSKKIIASLMALSIIGASSLTFGGTAKAATIKNNVKATNTINLSQGIGSNYISNKGYNFNASKDMYDNISVSIKPDDYKTHNYKATISYMDANNARITYNEYSKSCLVFACNFGADVNWTKVQVTFYADGDHLGEQIIYR